MSPTAIQQPKNESPKKIGTSVRVIGSWTVLDTVPALVLLTKELGPVEFVVDRRAADALYDHLVALKEVLRPR